MRALDRDRIEAIVAQAADRLHGDWLLVGGALVALWLEPRRVTEDIDLVGVAGTSEERLALLSLADELGLPVEALNSAADYFVRRIPGWERELEVLRIGARGRILRPTPTLFLLLKLRRLSSQDLDDCRAALTHASAAALVVDRARVHAALDALSATEDGALAERREALRVLVAAHSATG